VKRPRSLLPLLPRAAVALFVVVSLSLLSQSTAQATHDDYRYKFPCVPADDCYVTQLTHTGNAYDFDPQGSAGLGTIPAVSEGTFRGYVTVSEVCTTSGLGKYAVIEDMHGRTLRYAHLSAFGGMLEDERVLQGDMVGIEGNTGYTISCAPHLHLEGIAGAVIEGNSIGLGLYRSTNSTAGAYSIPGYGIRQKYFDLGDPWTSWASVGWTADWTGNQGGCGSEAFCRLKVHHAPDPLLGRWGSTQTFRLHPGTAVEDDGALMVGRWALESSTSALANTYRVRSPLFAAWVVYYQGATVGVPIAEQEGTGTTRCPTYWNCLSYQRFHIGYIWEQVGYPTSVFYAVSCPDVALPIDYAVRGGDISAVVAAYGQDEGTTPPDVDWDQARYDMDNSGTIRGADISFVVQHYGPYCYPS